MTSEAGAPSALIHLLCPNIYLAGVGVALAPTMRDKWNTATAADLTASVLQELPNALAWPVRAYRSLPQTPKN
jgi:hypothetical protein